VVHGQPTGARLLVFNRLMALALALTAAWMLFNEWTQVHRGGAA
jgi:hypothetical protein